MSSIGLKNKYHTVVVKQYKRRVIYSLHQCKPFALIGYKNTLVVLSSAINIIMLYHVVYIF